MPRPRKSKEEKKNRKKKERKGNCPEKKTHKPKQRY